MIQGTCGFGIFYAGEDPSNSSFRRAMRKASGTVSIVDKDAFCYTKLVTICVAQCSPPFRDLVSMHFEKKFRRTKLPP
jgi:hypothetical protein